MNDPIASGKTEAQSRASFEQRAIAGAKAVAIDVEDAVKRAVAGVEAWYAEHFHHAVQTATPAIPAEQKAALIAHVTAAIKPPQE